MGAHTRVAVETLKVPFVYHTLVANRADYKAKKNIENRISAFN